MRVGRINIKVNDNLKKKVTFKSNIVKIFKREKQRMSQNYFQQQSSQTWKIELSGQVFKCKILSAPKFPEAIYVLPKNYFWTRVYISLGW